MSKLLTRYIIDDGSLVLNEKSVIEVADKQISFEDIIERIEKLEREFLNFKNMRLLGLLDDEQ